MRYKNIKSIVSIVIVIVFVVLFPSLSIKADTKTIYNCQKDAHRYTVTIIKKPTETEDGIRQYVCDLCQKSYRESIKMIGHEYGDWIEQTPATCNDEGKNKRVCTYNEEHTEEEVIPALGHNYGKWITDKSASLFSEGEEHRTCSRDVMHIERRNIPMIIENITPVDFVITTASFSAFGIFAFFIASDISILIWYKRLLKKQRHNHKNNN